MPYKGSAKKIIRLTDEDMDYRLSTFRDIRARIAKLCEEFNKSKEPEKKRIHWEIIKEQEKLTEFFREINEIDERILAS